MVRPVDSTAWNEVVAHQGGVVSRAQCRQHGITEDAVRHAVARGDWQVLHDGGVYLVNQPSPGPLAMLWSFLLKVGGELTYAGIASDALVAEDGQAWDAIVIVKYPSRAAFSQMVADPGYQAITHLRTSALRETVLQPTSPWLSSRPSAA